MSITELYESKNKKPMVGDRIVTRYDCFRTLIAVKRSLLSGDSIVSECSSPKSCPVKGQCDLTNAVIERRK